MPLIMNLGVHVPGAGLVIAVEEAMRMMDGPQYRLPTGWDRFRVSSGRYVGNAMLHPGAWYPVSIVPSPEERALPHHGSVAVYAEDLSGGLILEVARHNAEYKAELDRLNSLGMILPLLIAPFQAAGMLFNRLDPEHPERYAKVTYEDSIFVEINHQRPYSSLEFHVNALDPGHGGGVVKSMGDVHFEAISANFLHLCTEICRELRIPAGPSIDSLYSSLS